MDTLYTPKVNKTTAERYDIRIGYDWGTFIVDTDGSLLINSSYGNWAYGWGNHGRESFKHFLIEMQKDISYLIMKLNGGKKEYFKLEETIQEVKKDIITERKNFSISKEDARDLYNFVKEDLEETYDQTHFEVKIYESGLMDKVYFDYHSIPLRTEVDPSLRRFIDLFWPVLISTLNQELNINLQAT